MRGTGPDILSMHGNYSDSASFRFADGILFLHFPGRLKTSFGSPVPVHDRASSVRHRIRHIYPICPPAVQKARLEKILHAVPVLLLSSGNIFFFLFGIKQTTANMSVVLYTLSPLLTAVFSMVLLKERVSNKAAAGIFLGLSGVVYTLVLPAFGVSRSFGTLTGNLLILLAVTSWTLYTIGSRKLMNQGFPVKALTGMSLIVNAMVFLLFSLATGELALLPSLLTLPLFLEALYLGVFVSIVTFVLYQWTIKHVSALVASLTLYLQPLFGVLVNYILLGESLSPEFVIGGLVIVSGVILATVPANGKGTRMPIS